jgi:A/G-specific adenine glycosylase
VFFPPDTTNIRRALLRWYRHHGRDLPWRRTGDPYAILVSEIMLQQTQVATVLAYFERWLTRFPTFSALAAASENDVLHAWQGLGYYSRARNFHTAAKLIVSRYGGAAPRNPEALRQLPGMGRYTANALATFAFDQSVPIVEANTARVLARLFNIKLPVDATAGREQLWQAAATLVPHKHAGRFNSALMDLGALVCVSRAPKCNICPVQTFCRAPHPELLPVKKLRHRLVVLEENHRFVRRGNKLLLQQCSHRWRGMWMLPLASSSCRAKRESCLARRELHSLVFPFTHHRITLRVFREDGARQIGGRNRWVAIDDLATIAVPSPHRRAIEVCLAIEH